MKNSLIISIGLFLLTCKTYGLDVREINLWAEDIRQLQDLIKTQHISPFVNTGEREFDAQLDKLVVNLPSLNEAEIEVGIMRLMRSIGDAHTSYNIMSGPHRHYPFRFKYFEEKLKVVNASERYAFLLGADLTGINGYTLEQLQQQLAPYVNYVENPYSYKASFSFHITLTNFLYGTGVSNKADSVSYQFMKDGKSTSVNVDSVSMKEFARLRSHYTRLMPKIHFSKIELPGIMLAILEKYDTAYLDFDRYPQFEQLREHCRELTRVIQEGRARNLVIDFRGNNGGDFYVGLALSACIQELDQFDWHNGIFVMIDEGTQSAAMINAAQYQQILNATLVGSPSGADPNIATEANLFRLKNSQRAVSISKRYYRVIPSPSDALYPDLNMKTSWEDYKHGKDGALLKLLNHIQEKDGGSLARSE
ncbi:S41 family peptidase [Microbulbifer sp. GL-2]|uniref:S41 family peptidase n=1 Tax=Microbulbifer sp. GL-2 TaxID=2591606 RepID=UPI0011655A54|nr:S41 family peptidase [Microbulbifer sp. GL-2]BBM00890.1 peptidase S41 [Microbulbifer sp. GL-2]